MQQDQIISDVRRIDRRSYFALMLQSSVRHVEAMPSSALNTVMMFVFNALWSYVARVHGTPQISLIIIIIIIIPGQFIKRRKWWFGYHIKGALTFLTTMAESAVRSTRVTSATLYLHVQAATNYTPITV